MGLGCTAGCSSVFPPTANAHTKMRATCNVGRAPRYYGMETTNIWRSNLERQGGARLAPGGPTLSLAPRGAPQPKKVIMKTTNQMTKILLGAALPALLALGTIHSARAQTVSRIVFAAPATVNRTPPILKSSR